MIEQFFSETFLELSDLELPHWLTAAGSVLVIVGTIGAGIEPACEGSETATKKVGNVSRARRAYHAMRHPYVMLVASAVKVSQ